MIDFVLWIVISDKKLADGWYRAFSREYLKVQCLGTIADLARTAVEMKGLALVEIGLPDLPDADALKTFVAGHSNLSVIAMAGTTKVNNAMITAALEAGADDFVLGNIDERVLLSKIKAHLRRILPNLACARTLVTSRNGDIEIDRTRRVIRTGLKNKKPNSIESLTPKEFDIFSILLSNEEQVVSRNFLMEEIWKEKSGQFNCETIDKHVETLRRKLGPYGKHIRTVYGTGYIFNFNGGGSSKA
ncbi:MAG: hypothetical protein A2X34_03815 [Elusimicrobia bacterium GWC2_51_8]|nr:MAG: hypothetical protein A2X33_08320 [Elusimicrobia bacterium GWA2_51_34]OGR58934.1 MAG: hypothetical protein A2X34_03815 [Elusimicrobia bacterium GWC2_51_8]OGR85244.1 MAG: hypothetical protein A2021_02295 [Elusimicrobia bacterium GWF2_52_66]HAF95247.1 hypothetical protein [Elusimicrobiota bacterium]HCE97325.1 hypothetical protein [Elusimicrobiota bacterium]